MSGPIRIGVAGWSYADWRGVVYPRGCKDELAFLSRHVDFIELNSSFYHVPEPSSVASWIERTADRDTPFSAKLPQSVTHERRLDRETLDSFVDAMRVFADAGRLCGLLAQFNFRFEANEPAFEHLRALAAALGDLAPLVVELRHASWAEHLTPVRELGFAIAQLDYPMRDDGFDGGDVTSGPLTYVRIHGRNHRAWYSREAGRDETYDYEYAPDERDDILERVRRLASGDTGATFVVANNHFRGKAVKLALELRAAVRGERVEVPDPLLDNYPDLRSIARGVLF